MATTEQLIFDILARDNASSAFIRAGRSAKDAAGNVQTLTDKLLVVSKQSADARVGLKGDKESNLTLDKLQAKLVKLGKEAANPDITVEGAIRAELQIAAVKKELDKLGKTDAKPRIEVLAGKAAGAGALAPSLGGALLGLSPAVIPLLAGITAGVGSLGIALGGAAIGAGAFGLLAKQALTGAGAAAAKVQLAQDNYTNAIQHGTKQAVAYKAEQIAITKAYYEMTPAQIRLSKTVGALSNAWQGVQQATTPLISGALVPWITAVTSLMKDIKPLVTPVADVFKAWGQAINTYFSSHKGSDEIHRMAVNLGQFSASQLGQIGQFILNIGKGIFNLGKDLVGAGANISAAGTWLSNMGQGFATWSKSAQARRDVQGFLHFVHTEGPVVGSIIRDLARYIPGIFQGMTATGALELRALSGLLGFIAKLPPSWAKPLTEAAGALLLLSKTGVLKIGFAIVGAAAGWIRKLLGGASVDIGATAAAAEIRAAMVSGGTAAAAEIRAAMASGGAVAATEEAAGGATAGAEVGAGTAAGGVAAGASIAGALAPAAAAAAIVIGAGLLANAVRVRGGLLNNPGLPPGEEARFGSSGLGPRGTNIPGFQAAQAASQIAAAAKRIQAAYDAVRADNQKLVLSFDAQGQSARAASTDLNNYTTAIYSNGVHSRQAEAARAQLIADLEGAGVKSRKANADVGAYTDAVAKNGIDSSQAAAARRRLVNDIIDASNNSTQGKKDLADYTTQVERNGASSDGARDARKRLITDLINSGTSAKTARELVDGLTTAIKKIPGSARVRVYVTGTGQWNVVQADKRGPQPGKSFTQGQLRAAGGLLPGFGGGDRIPVLAEAGEAIVDKYRTRKFAGVLRAMGVPGMASGGVVGSYRDGLPGEGRWAGREYASTARAIEASVAAATFAGMKQAIARAARSGAGVAGPGGGAPAANAALARRMMPSWGSGQEWNAWNAVAMAESGWNQYARNPSSGAYGIPQALPPSKMGAAANPPQSNPAAQISWMIGYIRSVYGDPIGAAAHENAFHWYGSGFHGWVNRPTLFGAGERGRERVDITPAGGHAPVVVLERKPGASHLEQALLDVVLKYVRVKGGGDVQAALGG